MNRRWRRRRRDVLQAILDRWKATEGDDEAERKRCEPNDAGAHLQAAKQGRPPLIGLPAGLVPRCECQASHHLSRQQALGGRPSHKSPAKKVH